MTNLIYAHTYYIDCKKSWCGSPCDALVLMNLGKNTCPNMFKCIFSMEAQCPQCTYTVYSMRLDNLDHCRIRTTQWLKWVKIIFVCLELICLMSWKTIILIYSQKLIREDNWRKRLKLNKEKIKLNKVKSLDTSQSKDAWTKDLPNFCPVSMLGCLSDHQGRAD